MTMKIKMLFDSSAFACSIDKKWCTNLSYLFTLILFSLVDTLILESPKVPLTYISCTMDKSSLARLVTYHIISMNYQLYPSTHNYLQGGHHHWGWISNQPIVNSKRYGPSHLYQPTCMKSQCMWWFRFNIVLPLASCYWIAQFGCNKIWTTLCIEMWRIWVCKGA